MATEFSLIKDTNIYFIPNMACISAFLIGDFGIADSIKNASLQKTLKGSTMNKKETEHFLKSVGSDFGNGFKSIEKGVFKSMFDMHLPVVKVMAGIPYLLAKIEDSCARALTLDGSSVLNPFYNPKSLNYKLYNDKSQQDAIDTAANTKTTIIDRNKTNIGSIDYSKIPTSIPTSTSNINGAKWVTISEVYSTGVKLDGVKYNTSYIYKDAPKTTVDVDSPIVPTLVDPILPDKPPVVVFGVYDENGKIENEAIPYFILHNDKYYKNLIARDLTNDEKKVTEWNKSKSKQDYLDGVKLTIKQELINKGKYTEKNLNTVFEAIKKSITDDMYKNIQEGSFTQLTTKLASLGGYDFYANSTELISKFKNFGTFVPLEVKFGGKNVIIDPENDYIMQVVKFSIQDKNAIIKAPVPKSNKIFNVAQPYSGYYQNYKYTDVLKPNQYDNTIIKDYQFNITKSNSISRVQNLFYSDESNYTYETNLDAEEARKSNEDVAKSKTNGVKPPKPIDYTNPKYKEAFGYDSFNTAKVFYIVEGVLKSENTKTPREKVAASSSNSTNQNQSKYYKLKDFATAIPLLITALITFFIDLLPNFNKLLEFLKNPFNAIFEIVTSKLGEVFDYMNKDVLQKYVKLLSLNSLKEKLDFLDNNLDLKKYVTVTDKNEFKYTGDGRGTINIFGYLFGIELLKGKISMILEKSDKEEENNKSDFKMILNLVMLPLQIFIKVIEFIIEFFQNLNIGNVASKMEYLITFEWLFDLLSIPNLLSFLGIDVDYFEILKMKKNNNKKDNNPTKKVNVNEKFKHPMKPTTPDLTGMVFDSMFNMKTDLFTEGMLVFFVFFEEVILKVIDMIFCTFNLEHSKRPTVDLTNFLIITPITTNKSVKDEKNPKTVEPEQLYTITFVDGSKISNLTLSQVEEYKNTHKAITFKYGS